MGYEDISGTRVVWTDYRGGNIAAASTVRPPEFDGIVMWKPFTITGISLGAGTTRPAGTSMGIRVWVNNVRKGLATVTLTGGAGGYVSTGHCSFTGPANSVVSLSVASVGGTVGVGHRYAIQYHHGWSA